MTEEEIQKVANELADLPREDRVIAITKLLTHVDEQLPCLARLDEIRSCM